jgi:hypothetical protein
MNPPVISLMTAAEGASAIKEHVAAADRRIMGKALADGEGAASLLQYECRSMSQMGQTRKNSA